MNGGFHQFFSNFLFEFFPITQVDQMFTLKIVSSDRILQIVEMVFVTVKRKNHFSMNEFAAVG